MFESCLELVQKHRGTGPKSKGAAAALSAALLVTSALPVVSPASAQTAANARSASQLPRARHANGAIVMRGDVNGTVARVQRALGLRGDRVFGPRTVRAVKAFQSRAGLARTGRVDRRTWQVLFRAGVAGARDTPPRPAAPGAAQGSCGGRIFAPVRGRRTSAFGDGRRHAGVDIATPAGTAVLAAGCGTVTSARSRSGYGNIVCIRHSSAFSTCYAHLASMAVSKGALVAVGQVIGRVGMTGRTSGPHLHFETRVNGRAQDPAPFLDGSRTIPGKAAPPVPRSPAAPPAPPQDATGGASPARD